MSYLFVTLLTRLQALADSRDERGAAAVEYGMLVALVAAVIVGTVAVLGPKIGAAFQAIVDAFTANGI